MLRLLVVIINYKTPQLVCDALDSLNGQLDIERDAVIVVDNKSQDDSLDKINIHILSNGWSNWVDTIESDINGGFSAGNNIGINAREAEYYLLLNSDAYVREKAIEALLESAENNPRAGIIGPKIEWPDGEQQVSCFYNITPANSFLHSARTGVFTKFIEKLNIHEVAILIEEHANIKPQWISFACVLLRKKMIQEIGLMDERYFMYFEDNDYCRRATDAEWNLLFEPSSRVVHLNQGASDQRIVRRLPDFYFKSRSRYFIKYYGRTGLLITNILWSLGRCISLLREVIERKQPAFHSKMWLDIWKGFFVPINK